MDTQNVTLAIPKDVLHKAKQLAVARRTSLSAMLAEFIREIVRDDELYEEARDRQLAMMKEGLDLGSYGQKDWSRDDLHER
jgi:hypothetical protein